MCEYNVYIYLFMEGINSNISLGETPELFHLKNTYSDMLKHYEQQKKIEIDKNKLLPLRHEICKQFLLILNIF